MTVDELALLPRTISGLSAPPSPAQGNSSGQGSSSSSGGYGRTPSTDMSFSPEAMALYTQFVGPPDGPSGSS